MTSTTQIERNATLDCLAFVDVSGETLLAREPFTGNESIRGVVEAMTGAPTEHIYVLRSFTYPDGREAFYEIMTPAVLALEDGANRARVEFWRPMQPLGICPQFAEGQQLPKSNYRRVGILVTPEDNAISVAYDYLEYPYRRWNPSSESGSSPSCNVGDILVMTSPNNPEPVAFVVAGIGFTKVGFSD